MFENISEKIKTAATVLFWIGATVCIVAGILMFSVSVIGGLITIIVGPICAWLSSLIPYALGEILDYVTDLSKAEVRIEEKLRKIEKHIENNSELPNTQSSGCLSSLKEEKPMVKTEVKDTASLSKAPVLRKCVCGEEYDGDVCPVCGKRLYNPTSIL